jgi:ribosomal-protein-alanine N-acetyltransferase
MNVEKLFADSPTFETERLFLRRLNMGDVNEYFEFASDPLVSAHTLWDRHEAVDDTRRYIKKVMDKYETRQAYRWGIFLKASNKLIGRTGLISWDVFNQKTEIGFALSSQHWNQGIVTEATQPIISYCFEGLDVNRIEGRCNHFNIGSAMVMEKLGMKLEGVLRKQLKIKGDFVDQNIYSIIRSDYESTRSND